MNKSRFIGLFTITVVSFEFLFDMRVPFMMSVQLLVSIGVGLEGVGMNDSFVR